MRLIILILLVLIATSCSREVVGAPATTQAVSTPTESVENVSPGAYFDPCTIPVTALNGVGMFAEPIKKGESTTPPMIVCDFEGSNGILAIVSTTVSSVEQMKLDPTAGNFVDYRLGGRTIEGGSLPALRNLDNCLRETETKDGWVSLYWTGQGDVCMLADQAIAAVDPYLPPPA